MHRRQTSSPARWLIANGSADGKFWRAVHSLPRGSGVLVLHDVSPGPRERLLRRLRLLERSKGLTIVDESRRGAARVHNVRELRRALLARTPRILLSPLRRTASHPSWLPLPRMRAAALARLAGRRLIALGGMDANQFRRFERLGFQAWAAVSAFRT